MESRATWSQRGGIAVLTEVEFGTGGAGGRVFQTPDELTLARQQGAAASS